MDDPWGSPWATTDNASAPSASPTKNILEPPRPAFLSTPSNLNLPSSQSPWLDEDAFADWSSLDAGPPVANPSPWAWGNDVAPIEQLTSSYEPRRKSSAPKWPISRSASPGLRVPPTSNSASSSLLSPDPWANHSPSITRDEREPIAHLPQLPDTPTRVLGPVQTEPVPKTPGSICPKEDCAAQESTVSDSSQPTLQPTPDHTLPIETATVDNTPEAPVQDGGNVPSPALTASTASDEDNDEDNDDSTDVKHAHSPITSIEESTQAKIARRKPSSKVQELVEMYDGIAKRTTITPERQSRPHRSASRASDTSAGDISVHVPNDDEPVDVEPEVAQTPFAYPESINEEASDDGTTNLDKPPKSMRPDHDPFDVDMSKLNSLITEPELEKLEPAGDVSDRIIHDSFTSISERKIWYRLSRHESLRKHNAGDDENYVRITWSNSTVRQETMQIVRRWMEEDSMGGRAFRGGFARKTGGKFFGWDSTTETTPVDLDRVFGRKTKRRGSIHRPTHSIGGLPSLMTAHMIPSSADSTPASAQAKDNWEGLATFGWSTGPGNAEKTQEPTAPGPKAPSIPLPLAFAGFDNKPKSHVSLPAFATSKPKVQADQARQTFSTKEEEEEEEEEDGEWGEMVSSATDGAATDSMSIPKTSWDSFSTNSLPDSSSPAARASDDARLAIPNSDVGGIGDKTQGKGESEHSELTDMSGVMGPTPAPASTTLAPPTPPDAPRGQGGSLTLPASSCASWPLAAVRRPLKTPLIDPPDPLFNGPAGVFAEGLHHKPPLKTDTRSLSSTETAELVLQFVQNLPDLSYMLR